MSLTHFAAAADSDQRGVQFFYSHDSDLVSDNASQTKLKSDFYRVKGRLTDRNSPRSFGIVLDYPVSPLTRFLLGDVNGNFPNWRFETTFQFTQQNGRELANSTSGNRWYGLKGRSDLQLYSSFESLRWKLGDVVFLTAVGGIGYSFYKSSNHSWYMGNSLEPYDYSNPIYDRDLLQRDLNHAIKGGSHFAWLVGAGVGVNLSDSFGIMVEARSIDLGVAQFLNSCGEYCQRRLKYGEIVTSIRYGW